MESILNNTNYTEQDLLWLARRQDTSKRAFLLVNPLQAKHVPSRPEAALEMMSAMGRMLTAEYPDTRLVIGFAETATAIGAVVGALVGGGRVFPRRLRLSDHHAGKAAGGCGLGLLSGGAQPRHRAEAVRGRTAGAAAEHGTCALRGG